MPGCAPLTYLSTTRCQVCLVSRAVTVCCAMQARSVAASSAAQVQSATEQLHQARARAETSTSTNLQPQRQALGRQRLSVRRCGTGTYMRAWLRALQLGRGVCAIGKASAHIDAARRRWKTSRPTWLLCMRCTCSRAAAAAKRLQTSAAAAARPVAQRIASADAREAAIHESAVRYQRFKQLQKLEETLAERTQLQEAVKSMRHQLADVRASNRSLAAQRAKAVAAANCAAAD